MNEEIRTDVVMAVRWADWELDPVHEHCAFTSRPVELPAFDPAPIA